MTTGIFAYDGFIDPAKYDGYKIFIANPLMPGDLAQQLNAGVISLMDSGATTSCSLEMDVLRRMLLSSPTLNNWKAICTR